MTLEDLKYHTSTFVEPISTNYRGVDVYEIPPNGQGITALIALNILENFKVNQFIHNSAEYLHLLIESLRLAFADTRHYVADPKAMRIKAESLLSKKYALERSKLINPEKAANISHGFPESHSGTVYFSVVDGEGNACSFINSNYMGFGTGLIPKNCGFTLQNRGHNLSLDKSHANCLEGGKRPFHTIIPGMAIKNGKLFASFGVMGGFMQPQGHVQVLLNMIDFGMNPQKALEQPRFCIMDGFATGVIHFEEGISKQVIQKLRDMGHNVELEPQIGWNVMSFGIGQIITKNHETNVLCAGSDFRFDGCAMGW